MITLNELSRDKVEMPDNKLMKVLKVLDNKYMNRAKQMIIVGVSLVLMSVLSGQPNAIQITVILLYFTIFIDMIFDRYYKRKMVINQQFKYIALQEIRTCKVFEGEVLCTFKDEGLYSGIAYLMEGHLVEKGDKVIVFSLDNKKFWCV